MKKLTKSYVVGGLVGLIGLLSGCGGGNPNVPPPVIDTESPVIQKYELDGQTGQELSQSRNDNYFFELIAKDNKSETLNLDFTVNGGKTYKLTLKQYNGEFPFTAQIPYENFTQFENYEGVRVQTKLEDLAGNTTEEDRFWKKSLSEAKAREVMTEGFEEKNPEAIIYNTAIPVNGINHNIDIVGNWRRNTGGSFLLCLEYNSLSDNVSNLPEDKKIYDKDGLKLYETDHSTAQIGIIDKNLSESKVKELSKTAVDEFKNYFNF